MLSPVLMEKEREPVDTATLLMLSQQGDLFIFNFSDVWTLRLLLATMYLQSLVCGSLYGVTVFSLPGGYQVSLEFVVRRSLKFSSVCLLTDIGYY